MFNCLKKIVRIGIIVNYTYLMSTWCSVAVRRRDHCWYALILGLSMWTKVLHTHVLSPWNTLILIAILLHILCTAYCLFCWFIRRSLMEYVVSI
ncbi:hypothetical protein BJ878DRAFT_210932 [Calycina marina]|uniref:Uncharacterized protein n=1 Tax=Calycina marina TaxID=1763456 RepID=A0A9P7YXZ0_9HELO|nr:hypothetical protein BJ878DRAFT_210932 [Calycina marina]